MISTLLPGLLLLLGGARHAAGPALGPPHYTFRKLAWSDEFNTPGLPDSTKWTYDVGVTGWGNH